MPGCKLTKYMVSNVGRSTLSAKQARICGEAAAGSGASSPCLEQFLQIGTSGSWTQNMERDLHSLNRKLKDIPNLMYEAAVLVQDPALGMTQVQWSLLLPHEFFGILFEKDAVLFSNIFGCKGHVDFWDHAFRIDDPWMREHPLRHRIAEDPRLVCAYRIFGDEAGLNKNGDRPLTVLQWHGDGQDRASHSSWNRQIPVFLAPLHVCIEGITIPALQEVAAWSFNCLAMGKWPEFDHTGEPFPAASWRGRRAGRDLTSDRRCGALVGSLGDWKWNVENYMFDSYWATEEICAYCSAVQGPGHCNFTRFTPCPPKSNDLYLRSGAARRSPLTRIAGWHLFLVLPDLMHCGPLGACQVLTGQCLKDLCDEQVWGDGGGSGGWVQILRIQLAVAFSDFKTFASERKLTHSHKRFTPLRLSLTSLSSFPLLKGKAHNILVVQAWLSMLCVTKSDGTAYSNLRACICTSWDRFFKVLKAAGPELNHAEVAELERQGLFMFDGWAEAAKQTMAAGRPAWKLLPKMHLMYHIFQDTIRTRRNPTHQWAFSDEDAMMKIAKVCKGCHGTSLGKRGLERWILQFFQFIE